MSKWTPQETHGNDAPWKARKTSPRFPDLSPALGNRIRDSHIPTGPNATVLCSPTPGMLALFERSRQPCYSVEILPGTLRPGSLETAVLFSQLMAGFGVTTNGRI